MAKAVLEKAYDIWKQEYNHAGTKEEFRSSISGYAREEQADGGISYGEMFAEAAADASRAIADADRIFVGGSEDNEKYLEKVENRDSLFE